MRQARGILSIYLSIAAGNKDTLCYNTIEEQLIRMAPTHHHSFLVYHLAGVQPTCACALLTHSRCTTPLKAVMQDLIQHWIDEAWARKEQRDTTDSDSSSVTSISPARESRKSLMVIAAEAGN